MLCTETCINTSRLYAHSTLYSIMRALLCVHSCSHALCLITGRCWYSIPHTHKLVKQQRAHACTDCMRENMRPSGVRATKSAETMTTTTTTNICAPHITRATRGTWSRFYRRKTTSPPRAFIHTCRAIQQHNTNAAAKNQLNTTQLAPHVGTHSISHTNERSN